jgi:hypothetical protein
VAGIFATWQPEYAERGIATFPYAASGECKKPLIRGYDKIGIQRSEQLALRMGDADGLACMAGPRNRITVIDVDARGAEGEALLSDVQRQFGQSRLITRTGRGGYHAYFRHSGEPRKIRPDPRRPVDVLGRGAIVLPPSKGALFKYEIIEGKIDDLANLTPLRPQQSEPIEGADELLQVQVGERDSKFWPHIKRYAHQAGGYDELLDYARDLNGMMPLPLSDAEVVAKCRHWWKKTERGENRWGIGQFTTIDHSLIDEILMKDSDAFALFMVLRRHHWGRPFAMANEMHSIMPEGGWRRQRFTAARDRLVNQWKLVREIRPASFRPPRAAEYAFVDYKGRVSKNGQ